MHESWFLEREKETEKEVSVSSPDNENKTGCMPSTGPRPKHISLAWTSYKQGNEKHMLESKVRRERLRVSDSHPKTFPLYFSCGLAVSNVILTAFISHARAACVFLSFLFFLPFPAVYCWESPPSFFSLFFLLLSLKKKKQAGKCLYGSFSLSFGKITTWFPVMFFQVFTVSETRWRLPVWASGVHWPGKGERQGKGFESISGCFFLKYH